MLQKCVVSPFRFLISVYKFKTEFPMIKSNEEKKLQAFFIAKTACLDTFDDLYEQSKNNSSERSNYYHRDTIFAPIK